MTVRSRLIGTALIFLAGAALTALLKFASPPPRQQPAPAREALAPPIAAPLSSATNPTGHSRTTAQIRQTLDELRRNPDLRDTRLAIDRLRHAMLNETDEIAAARAITDFIHRGEDAATSLPLIVGPEGCLSSAPTLRIVLLDLLPALDPTTALALARELIRHPSSPDEYALALRNLAWNDLDGDLHDELTDAFNRMLGQAAWLEQPSAGLLEAFDIALQIPSPVIFSRLSELIASRQDPRHAPLVRAASITLDRMILRDPSLLTHARRHIPQWLETAPSHRASLMSRLDLTQTDHQALLVEYLAAPTIGSSERLLFCELFPNGNYLHGHRLVSSAESVPTIAERLQLDTRALIILRQLALQAPETAAPAIQSIITRLQSHVR